MIRAARTWLGSWLINLGVTVALGRDREREVTITPIPREPADG